MTKFVYALATFALISSVAVAAEQTSTAGTEGQKEGQTTTTGQEQDPSAEKKQPESK